VIEELPRPTSERDLDDLGTLLAAIVADGASVSFMPPFSQDDARAWWMRTVADADPRAIFLVARDGLGIAGTVQVHPAWPPNQPHRGDVAKLLVHPRARRRGIGRALMARVEDRARENGLTLLTLDTVRGAAGDALYRSLGWTEVGVIPNYALNPDGSWCDTVVFYKQL
jgi:GNAT superfamily N-acetyltransferase